MSTDEERIYSIALTQIPGVGHIGAKRLVDGMGSATDVFRYRTELPDRLPGITASLVLHWQMKIILPAYGSVTMLLSCCSLKGRPISMPYTLLIWWGPVMRQTTGSTFVSASCKSCRCSVRMCL